MGEPIVAAANDLRVIKEVVTDGIPMPAVRYTLEVDGDHPIATRFTETLPKGVSINEVGFHEEYERDCWYTDRDRTLAFERVIGPDERALTVFFVRPEAVADPASAFGAPPAIDLVAPADPTEDPTSVTFRTAPVGGAPVGSGSSDAAVGDMGDAVDGRSRPGPGAGSVPRSGDGQDAQSGDGDSSPSPSAAGESDAASGEGEDVPDRLHLNDPTDADHDPGTTEPGSALEPSAGGLAGDRGSAGHPDVDSDTMPADASAPLPDTGASSADDGTEGPRDGYSEVPPNPLDRRWTAGARSRDTTPTDPRFGEVIGPDRLETMVDAAVQAHLESAVESAVESAMANRIEDRIDQLLDERLEDR